MTAGVYANLRRWAAGQAGFDWLAPLLDDSEQLLASDQHGDLPAWRHALDALPPADSFFDGSPSAPVLGRALPQATSLPESLMCFHPWRKGPLNVAGIFIDTEWRSDWKWDRIAPHIDLDGHVVLDVGCGNGYFGWRMLSAGARCVIGIDPTLVFVMQWLACRHFAGASGNHVLPLGIESLPTAPAAFDTVFSMGVLYHRKHPLDHLGQLAGLVRPGGRVVLETLVLRGEGKKALRPEGRYARMRNVWSIPTVALLIDWLDHAGLQDVELVDVSATTQREQRSTPWMRFESLAQCLDPQDHSQTVEGHPTPVRAMLVARAPG